MFPKHLLSKKAGVFSWLKLRAYLLHICYCWLPENWEGSDNCRITPWVLPSGPCLLASSFRAIMMPVGWPCCSVRCVRESLCVPTPNFGVIMLVLQCQRWNKETTTLRFPVPREVDDLTRWLSCFFFSPQGRRILMFRHILLQVGHGVCGMLI